MKTPGLRHFPVPPDDGGDSVPGNAGIAGNPAVALSLIDSFQNTGSELVRFGAVSGLVAELLARAFAAASPDFTRSLIRSRSNWAIPASMVAIIRPCGVSSSKVMPLMVMTETFQPASLCNVSSRSCVERSQRDSSATWRSHDWSAVETPAGFRLQMNGVRPSAAAASFRRLSKLASEQP